MPKKISKTNQTQSGRFKKGFSIFELSVVIVIVAFLTLGVMQGGEMVRQAKTNAAAAMTKSSIVSKMDGLVLWLETTMPNSFKSAEAADGSQISTWNDISNSNITPFNAQSIGSSQPTYTANSINGLPTIRFQSANSNCMSVANNFDGNAESVTLFLVWQPESDTESEMDMIEKWAGGTGAYPYVLRSFTSYGLGAYDGSNNPIATSTTQRASGVPHIVSARKIRNGTMNIWVNGTLEGTTIDNTTTSTGSINLFIGCRGNSTLYTNGNIGEIIIFNRPLSDQERADVETYLSKKWAITTS